jgi:hypothetical protein
MRSALLIALCAVIIAVMSDDCRCIFLAGTSQSQKLGALNYVCGAGLDCSPIQQGGPDFYPNTIESHASWAIDAWFQAHRDNPGQSCDFSGTAEIICEECDCVLQKNATSAQLKVQAILCNLTITERHCFCVRELQLYSDLSRRRSLSTQHR